MGEIRIASRSMSDPVEMVMGDYRNMLAEMLICCRIDYRHRV
jgi:hypothetical protein